MHARPCIRAEQRMTGIDDNTRPSSNPQAPSPFYGGYIPRCGTGVGGAWRPNIIHRAIFWQRPVRAVFDAASTGSPPRGRPELSPKGARARARDPARGEMA